jgi:hypothetical protein
MKALIDLREHVPRGREIDQSFGFQHRKIENGIADRDPDAGRGRSRCGKHAIGQILDRKVGCGIDRNEGAEGGIVGVGQDFPPFCIFNYFVIPGCAFWRRPGIHTPSRGYGS